MMIVIDGHDDNHSRRLYKSNVLFRLYDGSVIEQLQRQQQRLLVAVRGKQAIKISFARVLLWLFIFISTPGTTAILVFGKFWSDNVPNHLYQKNKHQASTKYIDISHGEDDNGNCRRISSSQCDNDDHVSQPTLLLLLKQRSLTNGYQYYNLHPSEIKEAERVRDRIHERSRRRTLECHKTHGNDDNDCDDTTTIDRTDEEYDMYRKNYAWMLEEDAFNEWRNRNGRFSKRRLAEEDSDPSTYDIEYSSFHENAVYSTIPDRNDPLHAGNRRLDEYHSYRHLSRYEKQHRIKNNIDLQANWNGIYVFDDVYGDDDYNDDENDDDDDDDYLYDVDEPVQLNDTGEVQSEGKHSRSVVQPTVDSIHNENVSSSSAPSRMVSDQISRVKEINSHRSTVEGDLNHHRRMQQVISDTSRRITKNRSVDAKWTHREFSRNKDYKSVSQDAVNSNLDDDEDTGRRTKQSSPRKIEHEVDARADRHTLNHRKNHSNEESLEQTAVTSESIGGQYNNYQEVPLSQGYGTHFANVWVGSPLPQRKTVIVDTGSHYTAFPCSGCEHCGAPHHTDPYYKPELSDTFHQLQCNECKEGVMCDNGRCKFHQAYTEGSSWEAVQVRDNFYCGGNDVLDSANPDDQRYAIDFMFGCQISMTGLFITQLADGIMGMSAHPATLPKKLYDAGKIEHNLFAMCYRRELGTSKRGVTAGSMTIGGVSNHLDTSPMVYAKNLAQVGWYTVYVKAIYIRTGGGQSARSDVKDNSRHHTFKVRLENSMLNNGKGVIVDSGTTDTYLNRRLAREFTAAWKQATGQPYSHSPMALTAKQLRGLPTILIQCQAYSNDDDPSIENYDNIPGYAGKLDPWSPKDLLIAIPATSYMDYSPVTKRYMSRLYFTETLGGVLGSNTMQGHNVLFDWQNNRIGFAESTCAYDKKDVPRSVMDDRFPSDCSLGHPILTSPCIENVDLRLCKGNPTNIALLGNETWTAVVVSPGNDAGISCVEAAQGVTNDAATDRRRKAQVFYDEPIVRCDGNGFCEEVRPCHLTCKQAAKAMKAKPKTVDNIQTSGTEPENHEVECGVSDWSACDYGCVQTRIESQMFTDGICHEVSRESRTCHIGACARNDPCRVPFIVHVILGFRKGIVSNWTSHSKEILVAALTTTLAETFASRNATMIFSEGSVHVVSALPWYHNSVDETYDDAQTEEETDEIDSPRVKKLGAKVVIEISMYNPLADINRTTSFDITDPIEQSTLTSIVQNISDRVRGMKPKQTCRRDELFVLAKHALATKKALIEDGFMLSLINNIKVQANGNTRVAAPFGPLYALTYNASRSQLLSVWTIRTGLEEEINYFGPKKPFLGSVVTFVQNLVGLVAMCFCIMISWNYFLWAYEYWMGYRTASEHNHVASMLLRRRNRSDVVAVAKDSSSIDEDMNTLEDSILIGNLEQQITGYSYKKTIPKKRSTRRQENM